MTVQTPIGKITATPDVLNMIAIAFYRSSEHNSLYKHKALSSLDDSVADEIYKQLDIIGIYDNLKN